MKTSMATTTRQSAEERRESILDAALIEFAERGLDGTSTEDIAKRAGISQPYVFRLFGSKKQLFAAACARCMRELREQMEGAAAGLSGEAALDAMGRTYREILEAEPRRLKLQMHMYAAAQDPEIRDAVRSGFGDLYTSFERISGVEPQRLSRFLATGMLLNVIAAMQLRDSGLAWAARLLEGCLADPAE
jgi:AcrR family transcriptional regulator